MVKPNRQGRVLSSLPGAGSSPWYEYHILHGLMVSVWFAVVQAPPEAEATLWLLLIGFSLSGDDLCSTGISAGVANAAQATAARTVIVDASIVSASRFEVIRRSRGGFHHCRLAISSTNNH